jgi:UDP-GlcNAc:undecaprenyl-phosphate/decaprenyl-phosphate GlcNAc-1-phosphate transferase
MYSEVVIKTIFIELLPFFVAFLSSIILTPIFKFIAIKCGIVDKPEAGKVHKKEIAYLGGLSFFFSFIFSVLLFKDFYAFKVIEYQRLAGIILGSTLIVILGLEDDARSLNAWEKLSGQIIVSSVLCFFGFRIKTFTNPIGSAISLDFLSIPFTILWIVLIINAINLLDGLDGLAGGVIFIASLSLLSIATHKNNFFLIFLLTTLSGCILGFLKYNFHPASIFMGDTGSMFLGFFIASITMIGNWKKATTATLIIPLIAIGVPVFDTLIAFLRRGFKGEHPFKRDTSHIHHRLLNLGLSHKQVVLLLYAITILFSCTAYLLVFIEDYLAFIVLFLLASAIFLGFETLMFIEKKVVLQNKKGNYADTKIVKITPDNHDIRSIKPDMM